MAFYGRTGTTIMNIAFGRALVSAPVKTNLATAQNAVRAFSTTSSIKSTSSPEDDAYFRKLMLAGGFDKREMGPSFKASDIQVELTKNPQWKKLKDMGSVKFGAVFTDHMLTCRWTKDKGWHTPRIEPFAPLKLHPAASILHYATGIFEGMKAFHGDDGKFRTFRPLHNMYRMTTSASRACLPGFDEQECLDAICELIKIERNWVPTKDNLGAGSSLYIRPTLIGLTGELGVSVPDEALFYTILSPVQSYFGAQAKAVSLLADPRFVRSAYGGVGDSKMACNYAPSLRIMEDAVQKGYQAVLWLYGEKQQVTEAGMMNVFFVLKNSKGEKELVTPPLDGLILPGSTRRSCIDLANTFKDKDYVITERELLMEEVYDASQKGNLYECFGSGTAAVILPIGSIEWKGKGKFDIPTMKQKNPVYKKLYTAITDIQYGRTEHEFGYTINV